MARFGSVPGAWDDASRRHSPSTRAAALEEAGRALDRLDALGGTLLVHGGAGYPAALLTLEDPPAVLFALGNLGALDRPAVAIVGTRCATSYGERATLAIGSALARAGATVVSGLARGIDAAAHRAALSVGGHTIAVLGTGVDVPYPSGHHGLHAEIAARGLVVAESLPGTQAAPGAFPRRNRIIAALASVTFVIEAPFRSGALLTAKLANDIGREVAAVPGPIDVPQCAGSNELMRDGAHVIASPADALALAKLEGPPARQPRIETASERAIWDALALGAADLDTLAARASLPVRECLTAVSTLEFAGAISCELTGEIRRR